MVVGVIQSNYIPWRGYFDFISSVDLFLFYDNVQFSSGGFRNRNQIRIGPAKKQWLTVPLGRHHLQTNIEDIQVSTHHDWIDQHLGLFKKHYQTAPYFKETYDLFSDCLGHRDSHLSQLNMRLTRAVCQYLNISTQLRSASEFPTAGHATDRLLHLLKSVGATKYLSGPSAASYLETEKFIQAQIELEYKKYEYPPYPQLHEGFDGNISILDTIACLGPAAKQFFSSN